MHDDADVEITQLKNLAFLHFKSWEWRRSSPLVIPPSLQQHGRLLTLAPGEWLLISDMQNAQTLHEHRRLAHEHGIAVVSRSSALAALRVEGHRARNVLSKYCGLDFHPSAFPLGSCTRTRLANSSVIIDYVDAKPRFDLYVGSSYRAYICSCLNDAFAGITHGP